MHLFKMAAKLVLSFIYSLLLVLQWQNWCQISHKWDQGIHWNRFQDHRSTCFHFKLKITKWLPWKYLFSYICFCCCYSDKFGVKLYIWWTRKLMDWVLRPQMQYCYVKVIISKWLPRKYLPPYSLLPLYLWWQNRP